MDHTRAADPEATWRTRTAWGFSEDTSDSMKPKPPSGRSSTGVVTLMPDAPQTTFMPMRTSAIGSVYTHSPSTIRPQSISGFSTVITRPSRRIRVGRLVVE